MTNPMTPTEQDKELHSKSYKLAQEYLSTNNLECFVDLIQNNLTLDEALQLITADRKRVALEEREKARKFYAKRKPQFTKTWVADILGISRPTLDKWIANPEQFTVGAVKRLTELKSQQEEE